MKSVFNFCLSAIIQKVSNNKSLLKPLWVQVPCTKAHQQGTTCKYAGLNLTTTAPCYCKMLLYCTKWICQDDLLRVSALTLSPGLRICSFLVPSLFRRVYASFTLRLHSFPNRQKVEWGGGYMSYHCQKNLTSQSTNIFLLSRWTLEFLTRTP